MYGPCPARRERTTMNDADTNQARHSVASEPSEAPVNGTELEMRPKVRELVDALAALITDEEAKASERLIGE